MSTDAYPFGEHLVLAGGEAEPLRLLSPPARAIWQGLAAGLAPDAVARDLALRFGLPVGAACRQVTGTIAAWRDGGLLNPHASAARPAPAPVVRPRLTWLQRSMRRTYALCGQPIAVRYVPPALEALVHPRFAHSERPDVTPVATLTLARAGDGYALLQPGRPAIVAATDLGILGEFVRRFVELSHPPTTWIAVLHAAALGDSRGQALILPGANGSGKSTLVAALLSAGYSYLSDDCAPLDRQGRVVPVPLGLCLKEPSWSVAAPHLPGLWTAPLHQGEDGRRCRYVPPPPDRPTPLPLATIVFPNFDAGTDCRLDRLDPVATLRRLVAGRAWLSRAPDELRGALALIERVPAFALRYGDLEAAVAAMRDLRDASDVPAAPA